MIVIIFKLKKAQSYKTLIDIEIFYKRAIFSSCILRPYKTIILPKYDNQLWKNLHLSLNKYNFYYNNCSKIACKYFTWSHGLLLKIITL